MQLEDGRWTTGKESNMRRGRRVLALALLVGIVATAWAGLAASSSGETQRAAASSTVTISNAQGSTWTCGFNPFNPSVNPFSIGTVYETLTFVNQLKSGATTSWLASGYAWSNHNRTLTFTIRSGVKWSDGTPFSAADVLY